MTDDQLSRRDPLLRLRALIDFDAEREIYIAQCLETGSVATADDPQTAQEMIVEVLDVLSQKGTDEDSLVESSVRGKVKALLQRFPIYQ